MILLFKCELRDEREQLLINFLIIFFFISLWKFFKELSYKDEFNHLVIKLKVARIDKNASEKINK